MALIGKEVECNAFRYTSPPRSSPRRRTQAFWRPVVLRFVDRMIDTTIPVKVDGSINIELPQQSTLQRDDKHRLKGSLGTNLLLKEEKSAQRLEGK